MKKIALLDMAAPGDLNSREIHTIVMILILCMIVIVISVVTVKIIKNTKNKKTGDNKTKSDEDNSEKTGR